ncbi:hypothetical protein [Vulgatibacter sp.]|uniref:hypothetical protein n=1 Tax=Vulgatibacter sp. TaxID=1971226 RepID=UPI0035634C87
MEQVDTSLVHEGMRVRNPDGEKIGHVVAVEGAYVRIKQGWLLPDEIYARSDDIVAVRDGDLILELRGTIPGEYADGRNEGSRGKDVAERNEDTRLL